MLLDDIQDVELVWINVANANKSSWIKAIKMGTAKLHAFDVNAAASFVHIPSVSYSPALPANLIPMNELYKSGYKIVHPHYGTNKGNVNMYFSDSKNIIPAFKDAGPGRFWRFYHFTEPCVASVVLSKPNETDIWHLQFGHLIS